MTPTQQQAIAAVRSIMMQNFDAFVLSYRITGENLDSKINHEWHGNITDVIGLVAITEKRLLEYTSLRGLPNDKS